MNWNVRGMDQAALMDRYRPASLTLHEADPVERDNQYGSGAQLHSRHG